MFVVFLKMLNGNIWCTDAVILANEADNFFKGIFIDQHPRQGKLLEVMPTAVLSSNACETLLLPVTKDEVWNALRFMKAFKASAWMVSNLFSSRDTGIFWVMMFGGWLRMLLKQAWWIREF